VTDNVVSGLRSKRAQGRPEDLGGTSQWDAPGVYYAVLTLGGRVVMVKLLVQEREDSSATHVRYLYTTDPSLSGILQIARAIALNYNLSTYHLIIVQQLWES
jgi:hypothetical protein